MVHKYYPESVILIILLGDCLKIFNRRKIGTLKLSNEEYHIYSATNVNLYELLKKFNKIVRTEIFLKKTLK